MMFSLCRSSRATFQPADQNDKAAAVSHCSPADLLYVPGTAPFPQLSCQPFLTLFPLYDCCTWRGLYRTKNIFKIFSKYYFSFTILPTSSVRGTSPRVGLFLHFLHFRLSDAVLINVEILRPIIIIE